MHGAHPPLVATSPLANPLPEPWDSYVSNETGCPVHFEALSPHLLPLDHHLGSSTGVIGIHLAVADLRLHKKSFLLKYLTSSKNICIFFILLEKKNEIYLKIVSYLYYHRWSLVKMACLYLL